MFKVLGLNFGRDAKDLEKYPKIDELFEEAEKIAGRLPKNELPKDLENLYVKIHASLDLTSKKLVTIEEIEKFSPLYAHQMKNDILRKLVEMGFEEKFGNNIHLRFGKRSLITTTLLISVSKSLCRQKLKPLLKMPWIVLMNPNWPFWILYQRFALTVRSSSLSMNLF